MELIEYEDVRRKVAKHLKTLDPDTVFLRMKQNQLVKTEDILRALIAELGAERVVDMLISGLYVNTLYKHLDQLIDSGASIDYIVNKLNNHMLFNAAQIRKLLTRGANPDVIIDKIDSVVFHAEIDIFTKDDPEDEQRAKEAGKKPKPTASPQKLLEKAHYIDYMNGRHFIQCLHNSGVDMDAFVEKITIWDMLRWSGHLLENGATIKAMAKRLMSEKISEMPTSLIVEQYKGVVDHLISLMDEDDAKNCRKIYAKID